MFSIVRKTLIVAIALTGVLWYSYHSGYKKAETKAILEATEQKLKLESEYRAKEKEWSQLLSKVLDERDEAIVTNRAINNDLDRVRKLADQYSERLPETADSACQREQNSLRRSARLLTEGAELLTESSNLLTRVSADHDALAKVYKEANK